MKMRAIASRATLLLCSLVLCSPATAEAPASKVSPGLVRTAPKGAPNIVIVLLDDVGFGTASTFGGPVATPAMTSLAGQGLLYNRFHTTAMCSPTRAALLSGRNAHATGIGAVIADSRPGYTGLNGEDTATIAEVLRENGFSTAAFGKWHQTAGWQDSQSGPFDHWPTGEGFEKFYGFLGGETDQYEPSLFEGTAPVMRPAVTDYHLTEDLVDRSIGWFRSIRSVTPNKPFFLYLAPGAIHAPLQVPDKWIAPYRGQFNQGWDQLREETFARQKRLGIIPANTQLSPRPAGMPAWDSLTPDEKRLASRLMETYAGFMAHTDAQIGRLVEALKQSGEFDNTLFLYVVGDNGASAEGGLGGSLDYLGALQGMPEPLSSKLARIDAIGGKTSHAHINAGWAWAANTPFQWTKTVASHLGGTRNGLIVSWPSRITAAGGVRSQFGHVNDIVPTILDAVGLDAPALVHGVKQKRMDGASLLYSFNDGAAPERHHTQYFEVFGHRAIYHDGWMASAFHSRIPWGAALGRPNKPFEEDKWELYDLRVDFSQAVDLADKYPEKLQELKAIFQREAEANQVLPLKGQQLGDSGLPSLATGATEQIYYPGAVGVPADSLPRIFNRPWSVEAQIDAGTKPSGVIAAFGGSDAGWALYVDAGGRPVLAYRLYGIASVIARGKRPLPPGASVVRFDFEPEARGFGKPADLSLWLGGMKIAEGRTPTSPPIFYSLADSSFDVGIDTGAPVGNYPAGAPPGFPANGLKIGSVKIRLR